MEKETHLAAVDFLAGVFGHLLFEQLVGCILPYHCRHGVGVVWLGFVLVGLLVMLKAGDEMGLLTSYMSKVRRG